MLMHEFNLNNVEGLEWVCIMIKKNTVKTIEDYWRQTLHNESHLTFMCAVWAAYNEEKP